MKSRQTSNSEKKTISYVSRELLAGGIAGSAAKTIVAPFDRVKILFQASSPQFLKYAGTWTGVFRATHEIYCQSGVRGLFQGHSATLLRIFPYAAIKFMAYGRIRSVLMPTKSAETNLKRFAAGAFSGSPSKTVSAVVSHPTPVSSPKQSRIFAAFPVLKFYRGFSITILGMIPYAGTSFLAWDSLRAMVYRSRREGPGRIDNLVIGAMSGVLGQTVSYPLEVVRRRMQIGGLIRPDRWMSWGEVVKSVWKSNGWRGFYVGLSIGYLKVVPMTAVSFAVWEEMKRILLQIPFTTITSSERHHRGQPEADHNDDSKLPYFSRNNFTLEAAKRIWSSYSPINIGHYCTCTSTLINAENRKLVIDENVLGLHLGSPSTTTSTQSSSYTVTTGLTEDFRSSLQNDLNNNSMGSEPEPGEILDESRHSASDLSDMQSNNPLYHRHVLDQARSGLADSFLKTLKTRDHRSCLSRQDVFQSYISPINDHQLDQLVTIGKEVFEDLIRLGKMDDTKRKLSAILEGEEHHHHDRRVKRRSEGDGPSPALIRDKPLVANKSISTTPATSSTIHTDNNNDRIDEDYGLTSALSHPAILMVNGGRCHASTIDATFELPECMFNAADRWAKRLIKLHILKSTVENIYSDDLTCPFPSSLVDTFSNVDTSWPSNGGLFVSLNHEHTQNTGIWTPRNFTPGSPRLDITNRVVSGRNTMRLIQLQDYSNYIFFILATPRNLNEGEIRHCRRWEKSFGAWQPGKTKKI
ncbi:hypothetical protein Clacol_002813 [Clathrus columnatus]|uniref:Mitochondrial carrier protein n=1 Tax=Clathrus columnatus TaxID=1419009 RepID=A0AAV5A1U0_9AGAM|nr:hypothetical protein Clacol_002813 [Clathrus columnatus]